MMVLPSIYITISITFMNIMDVNFPNLQRKYFAVVKVSKIVVFQQMI